MSSHPAPERSDDQAGTTVGTTGASARATVTPWGEIAPWDGTAPLAWWVAADDRWHRPAEEPTVRQRRVGGAPVVETLVRVPGGDVAHTAYATTGQPVLVVVELENRSPSPVAVALSRADVLTVRPPASTPPQGIELPEGSIVLPVAHRTSVRVALAVGEPPGRRRRLPPAAPPPVQDLPSAAQVARGWRAVADSSVRLVLPDADLDEAVVAARADLLLDGPADPAGDPAGFLLGVGELVRLGQSAEAWVDDLVEVAEGLGASHRRATHVPWDVPLALRATAGVLHAAGEHRGARDALAMLDRLPPAPPPPGPAAGLLVLTSLGPARLLAATVDALCAPRPGGADLLGGLPPAWYGQGVELYRAPGGPLGSTVSAGVRWHGERPALLWESSGGVRLTAAGIDPSWSTEAERGEALLAAPPAAPPPAPPAESFS